MSFRDVLEEGRFRFLSFMAETIQTRDDLRERQATALEIMSETVARAFTRFVSTYSTNADDITVALWPGLMVRDTLTGHVIRYEHEMVFPSKNAVTHRIPYIAFDYFLGENSSWLSSALNLPSAPSTHKWLMGCEPMISRRPMSTNLPYRMRCLVVSHCSTVSGNGRTSNKNYLGDRGCLFVEVENGRMPGQCLGESLDLHCTTRWPYSEISPGGERGELDLTQARRPYDFWLAACFMPSQLSDLMKSLPVIPGTDKEMYNNIATMAKTPGCYRNWISWKMSRVPMFLSDDSERDELGSFMLLSTCPLPRTPAASEFLELIGLFVESCFLRVRTEEDSLYSRTFGSVLYFAAIAHDFRKWAGAIETALLGCSPASTSMETVLGRKGDTLESVKIDRYAYDHALLYSSGLQFLFGSFKSADVGFIKLNDLQDGLSMVDLLTKASHCAVQLLKLGEQISIPKISSNEEERRADAEQYTVEIASIERLCGIEKDWKKNYSVDLDSPPWDTYFVLVDPDGAKERLHRFFKAIVRSILNFYKHGRIKKDLIDMGDRLHLVLEVVGSDLRLIMNNTPRDPEDRSDLDSCISRHRERKSPDADAKDPLTMGQNLDCATGDVIVDRSRLLDGEQTITFKSILTRYRILNLRGV